MTPILSFRTHRATRLFARLFVRCFAYIALATLAAASDPDQSRLAPPSGDGWQMLAAPAVPAAPFARPVSAQTAMGAPVKTPAVLSATASKVLTGAAAPTALRGTAASQPVGSLDVAPVVVSTAGGSSPAGGVLSLTITPQDINLRNALDRWFQQQGWQLAWKIDDDLPLEFNATFSGDFKSVLTQVMQATNHMRTPTRVCKHTNNVIRVVARAANCQE